MGAGGVVCCVRCCGNGDGLLATATASSAAGGSTRTPCIPAIVLAGILGGGWAGCSKEEQR